MFSYLIKLKIVFSFDEANSYVSVVVAQLVERSFALPEVHGSNLVIGKLLYRTFVYCQLYRKNEKKKKEAGNGPFKKQYCLVIRAV